MEKIIINQRNFTDVYYNHLIKSAQYYKKDADGHYFYVPYGICFYGCDLSGISFMNLHFEWAEFIDCNIYNSRFDHALFEKAEFKNVNIFDSGFYNTYAMDTRFENCKFYNCYFNRSVLIRCEFVNSGFNKYTSRCMEDCEFAGSYFANTKIPDSVIRHGFFKYQYS